MDEAVRRAALAAAACSRLEVPPDGGPLSEAASEALKGAQMEGARLRLTRQLDRATYDEIATALARIGGRWVRAGSRRDDGLPAGYHAFPTDSTDLLHAMVESGRLPPRNPTAFFPSPAPVVDRLMAAAELGAAELCEYRFLEPHAGQGAIADRIRSAYPGCVLDLVEALPLNVRVLKRKGYRPVAADFLHFQPGRVYDRIIANPPFSLPGAPRAYQAHIRHAWDLLTDRGLLVAVIPAGLHQERGPDREFHRWVAERGSIEDLPEGAFKASGTAVSTAVVCLDRRSAGWKRKAWMGWVSWHAWQAALWADNAADLYAAERRIYDDLRDGRFGPDPLRDGRTGPFADMVRSFYERSASQVNRPPHYAGVVLDEADHDALRDHLAARYAEHARFASCARVAGAPPGRRAA